MMGATSCRIWLKYGRLRMRLFFGPSMGKRLRLIALLIAWACMFPKLGSSQMVPDGPVINFSLPMFAESGFKKWELRGREGRYISSNRIDVVDLVLLIYSGDESQLLETTIESPAAVMLIDQSKAFGDCSIHLTGRRFWIEGQQWSWNGDESVIVIGRGARVVFSEEIGAILR